MVTRAPGFSCVPLPPSVGSSESDEIPATFESLLVTVPVPEEFEVPAVDLERALGEALREAESQHVMGRELTPFLLSRMAQISEGATLKANIALLENNAHVAAQIAEAIGR